MAVLWQRLGRAGRNLLLSAFGVLLAEKKHFEDEKARRRIAAEKRQALKRKRAHEDLLEPEESNKRTCKQEDSDPVATSASNGSPSRPKPSTRPIASTKRSSRPPKATNYRSRPVETGVDDFINAHLAPSPEHRCRRRAINRYFGNPTEGELFI
jgi:hypothetical protein